MRFMTTNIPGLNTERDIMRDLPGIINNMIDTIDPLQVNTIVARLITLPIDLNNLAQVYFNLLKNKPGLINNDFMSKQLSMNELKQLLFADNALLVEIIKNNKNKKSIKILTELLFEYFNTKPGKPNLNLLVPAFIDNKDQIYNLIETDNLKNPTNSDRIRQTLGNILIKIFEQDKPMLTDKTIKKLLLDEKSIVNIVIKYLDRSRPLTNDEKANYIQYLVLKNNAVESDRLLELDADIILRIINSDYTGNQDFTTIGIVILILVEKQPTYFDAIFDQLVMIIKDSKPELLQILANRQFTTNPEHYTFIARLLNRILELDPNFIDSHKVIKTILLNNSELIKKMNELKANPVIIVGRITKDNLEQICKYEGDLTFIDRRINNNSQYDLNILPDEIMQDPINPITKLNDDFHNEYEQLIKDNQADFTKFNNGTNFIRKIKIVHQKIK